MIQSMPYTYKQNFFFFCNSPIFYKNFKVMQIFIAFPLALFVYKYGKFTNNV